MRVRSHVIDRGVKRCRIALALSASAPREVFAAMADGDPAGSRAVVFIITVTIASVIAVWLYLHSKRISDVQRKGDGGEPAPGMAETEGASIVPTILREIGTLRGSDHQREQVARALSQVMTQQVEVKASMVRREIAQQYEQIIEEKTRSEAETRTRYDTMLGEKQQTESVMRSIAEGLVVVNNEGKVVFMNPAAEKLLGVKKEDKLGRVLSEGLKDEQLVSLVKGAGEEPEREIELSSRLDDTKKVLRASNAVVEDESGKTVGMVAVLSDVTKQRELDQLKSEFVSTVSHELRTPIVAMQHSLAVLLNQTAGPLAGSQEKFLVTTNRNLERLSRLIDDLLDLGKLEARKMECRCAPASMPQLIDGACETLNAWAQSKGIGIEKKLQDPLPSVHVDPERITQVLQNLIGNAIKFTPPKGSITIEARPRDGEKAVEVSVADTGVGIPREALPKLFHRFQQVDGRTAAHVGGTGLGLAIAKEIIELHGGKIWAEADQGHGAKFVFTVPIATRPDAGG